MARIHGRNGALYVGVATGTTVASPVTFLNKWTIDFKVDTVEVTALGDATKVYVASLPDAQGTYAGFWDNATPQTYTATLDGVARRFYLYPDVTTLGAAGIPSNYWFGTALFDFSVSGGSGEAVAITGNWHAFTSIAKVTN